MKRHSLWILWATISLIVPLSASIQMFSQAADNGVKTFGNSIVKLPPGAVVSNSPHALTTIRSTTRTLHFSLTTANFDELETRVLNQETVTPGEMKEKYVGSKKSAEVLVAWLKGQGFKIVQVTSDNTSVYAAASVDRIEKSLGVKMVPIKYKGVTAPTAVTPPQLPKEIGAQVVGIEGLQPFVRAVKHTVTRSAYLREQQRGKKPVPRRNLSAQPTYKIKDILAAYNATGLGTGEGQTIAILIDTFPSGDDLATFYEKNNLPKETAQKVKLINVQGDNTQLPPTEGEETLDTEWVSGIAPDANVRVYASGDLDYSYLDRALEVIYADALNNEGLRQVSISLGLREDEVPKDEITIEHAIFVKLAAIGVTVFVSTGDAGSNPDITGHDRSPDAQVEYEASDPFTVGVGGTSLTLDRAKGTVVKETGWSDSGGGVSGSFARPSWQAAYPSISLAKRLLPDVSCVADPDPGAFVWYLGKEWPVGGTSWSAPIMAGFNALIGASRHKQGKAPLGYLAPLLYKLTPTELRDITEGNNGAYTAGAGWDPVTGLGVPNVKAMLLAFH
jgi:kumamolisin